MKVLDVQVLVSEEKFEKPWQLDGMSSTNLCAVNQYGYIIVFKKKTRGDHPKSMDNKYDPIRWFDFCRCRAFYLQAPVIREFCHS